MSGIKPAHVIIKMVPNELFGALNINPYIHKLDGIFAVRLAKK